MKSRALIPLAVIALLGIALFASRIPESLAVASLFESEKHAGTGKPYAPAQTACNSCDGCSDKLASGTYVTVTLTTDLLDVGGTCVIIYLGESNVVFDCGGHTIDGDDFSIDPEQGIAMLYGTNNKIMNCTVSGFDFGIYLVGATDHAVVNNTAISNGVGINLSGSDSTSIHANTSNDNYTGIKLINSDNNAINSNIVCDNIVVDFDLDESGTGNTGDHNTCDQPGDWHDEGTAGCSWGCDVQHIYLPIALRDY
jgi:parallel beta-helix repeat protein